MSPVVQWINCSIPFSLRFSSFFSDRKKWQVISLPAWLCIVVRARFLKHRSSETFLFFCCFCYIVDYEIIWEAISRLKANLNKNRSSIICKENSRSDLLFYEMKRKNKKELRHIRSSNVILFHFFFSLFLCHCFFLLIGDIFIVYIY